MAAKFTEVTLDDMERFLKRGYRVLRPKKGESRGEVYYDLNLSDNKIFVRVWTSIKPRSGTGADVGQDAIRVTMITRGGKALMPKGKIVKRTQNWRTNLQDRIDELLEVYESKTEYWKGRQQSRDEEAPPEPKAQPKTPPPTTPPVDDDELVGQFTKYRGDWAAKIFFEGSPGSYVTLKTKTGREAKVRISQRLWKGQDRYSNQYVELWTFEKSGNRYAATDPKTGKTLDLEALLVSERYLSRV